jgi:hypothetical protein
LWLKKLKNSSESAATSDDGRGVSRPGEMLLSLFFIVSKKGNFEKFSSKSFFV